jgi:hypothetical protein
MARALSGRVLFILPGLLALCLAGGPAAAFFISQFPTVNADVVVADGTTVYTVTMSATHPFGHSKIECLRMLFNYTQAGGDRSKGRGYLAWAINDSEITRYGGTWTSQAAEGGGRWGYRLDAWGGDTYIEPLSCSVTRSGLADGGDGTVTVTWSFKAKPAWARNPLINSADAWAQAAGSILGWQANPAELVVTGAPCSSTTPAPRAVQVSEPGATGFTISIHPDDPSGLLYLIRVEPSEHVRAYVQEDGTIGPIPVWRTREQWQGTRVQGLWNETPYTFRARAVAPGDVECPSEYGPAAGGTTLRQTLRLELGRQNTAMRRGICGMATNVTIIPSRQAGYARQWDLTRTTSVRGPAGGLDADTYNWKDMSGTWVGHTGNPGPNDLTTLEWLRLARDYQSTPVITANSRGIGPLASSGNCRFYYTDTRDETIARLAGDWVRYVNHILRVYRQGDVLPPADQAILDSITWPGRPKLLAPGEPPTPRVDYWEIGNEPEIGMPYCYASGPIVAQAPAEYARVYKAMAQAMLAADPNVKLGPCITTVLPGQAHGWLEAVLADPACPVHFIAYHPYGFLFYYAANYGDTPSSAERGLRDTKKTLVDTFNGVREKIAASGRNPASIELLATEWNVSHWRWDGSTQIRRQAHALGVAETLLTLAEQGIKFAHYWFGPSTPDGTETPGYKMFKKAIELWGDRFIASYSDGYNFRAYLTWRSDTSEHVLWFLNFSEQKDKVIEFVLPDIGTVSQITMHRLQNVNGTTSLFDRNDPPASSPPVVDWIVTDLTGQLDPRGFTMVFPRATVTALVLKQPHVRDLPLYTPFTASNLIVSAAYPSEGYFYAQTPDRSWGIRVQGPASGLAPGDRVTISGVMSVRTFQNIPSERQIASATVTKTGSGPAPEPLVMNCRSVGGGPFAGTPGVRDGTGLNNIGLLVTITGEVKQIIGSFIHVDDGTGVKDVPGRIGVLVRVPSTSGLSVGDIVRVTGVIEGSIPLGWTQNRRYIRARTASDIAVLVDR